MLSIVPLFAVAVAVATSLQLDEYRQTVTDFLEANLLPEAARAAGRYVVDLAGGVRLRTLGMVGGATLVILSIMLFISVERAINEIFRCSRARPLWIRVLIALTLLVLAPIALGLSLYFTGQLVVLPKLVGALTPLLLTVLTIFFSYWFMPHTRIRVRFAAISALVAGIMLEAVKIGFAFYAKYLGATLSYVYGAFAILPLSLIWIYLTWVIFLFGAEFNAALHEVKRHDHFDE